MDHSFPPENRVDVLIVGTGVAGLVAARLLQRAQRSVVLLDKGRGLGGRLASRRIGSATFDHGAQFITTRDARFEKLLREGEEAGMVTEWCKGFSGLADGHTRWRGQPSMTAVAKYLAQGLDARMEMQVVAVRRAEDGYSVETQGGASFHAAAVLLTPPVPQTLALLNAGGIELDDAMRKRLGAIEYERCIAVMAVLDGPSLLPSPGGFAPTEGPAAWIADTEKKGISAEPAITIHASPEFSFENWDEDREKVGQRLIDFCKPWLGSQVKSYQVHGWRYSKPMRVDGETCAVINASPPLVIAGDAFAGPRVEGAALSGFSAAEVIMAGLPQR